MRHNSIYLQLNLKNHSGHFERFDFCQIMSSSKSYEFKKKMDYQFLYKAGRRFWLIFLSVR